MADEIVLVGSYGQVTLDTPAPSISSNNWVEAPSPVTMTLTLYAHVGSGGADVAAGSPPDIDLDTAAPTIATDSTAGPEPTAVNIDLALLAIAAVNLDWILTASSAGDIDLDTFVPVIRADNGFSASAVTMALATLAIAAQDTVQGVDACEIDIEMPDPTPSAGVNVAAGAVIGAVDLATPSPAPSYGVTIELPTITIDLAALAPSVTLAYTHSAAVATGTLDTLAPTVDVETAFQAAAVTITMDVAAPTVTVGISVEVDDLGEISLLMHPPIATPFAQLEEILLELLAPEVFTGAGVPVGVVTMDLGTLSATAGGSAAVATSAIALEIEAMQPAVSSNVRVGCLMGIDPAIEIAMDPEDVL